MKQKETSKFDRLNPKAATPGRRKPKNLRRWESISALLVTVVILLIGGLFISAGILQTETLWPKIGRPLLRTLFSISLGLLIGQLIEALGLTTRLGRLVWPLINWARLPGAAAAAFVSAFVSGVVANTMLFAGWQEGRLSKKGLVLANLLNGSIPAYVLHMPTMVFIVVSLAGKAGVIYIILTFAAAWLRLFGVILVSRMIMPECEACSFADPVIKKSWREIWSETRPKFKARLKRMIMIVVPVYLSVILAAEAGFFTWLREAAAGWIATTVVPVEAMSLVVFAVAAEFTSGFAAAGALLESGTIAVKEAVLALLIGNVAATPIRALRHQLPHYMGIYSPGLGAKILLIGQGVRVLSIVLIMGAALWLW